jgi:three-Cys-motif partner protein
MSAKKDTTWPAEPHTFAKTAILKNYLIPYFYMLGSSFSDEILYVDGFAGPGVYENGKGSPIEALVAASKVLVGSKEKMKTSGITAAFIEKSKKRFAALEENIEPFKGMSKLTILPLNGEFTERLTDIASAVPSGFLSSSSFLFY